MNTILNNEQLTFIYPQSRRSDIQKFLPYINRYMPDFGINTATRQAAFLAQIGHESGQLRYVEELASGKAYEGRKDLGNVHKGDGTRFKGRGLIQITGRSNYQQISKALAIDLITCPELLKSPALATQSACWWWRRRGLNELADIATDTNFKKITRIINGGYNGYQDRFNIWQRAKDVLLK